MSMQWLTGARAVVLGTLASLGLFAGVAGAQPVEGSWQLVRFEGSDGSVLTPDDRTKYTLAFDAKGTVADSGIYEFEPTRACSGF